MTKQIYDLNSDIVCTTLDLPHSAQLKTVHVYGTGLYVDVAFDESFLNDPYKTWHFHLLPMGTDFDPATHLFIGNIMLPDEKQEKIAKENNGAKVHFSTLFFVTEDQETTDVKYVRGDIKPAKQLEDKSTTEINKPSGDENKTLPTDLKVDDPFWDNIIEGLE